MNLPDDMTAEKAREIFRHLITVEDAVTDFFTLVEAEEKRTGTTVLSENTEKDIVKALLDLDEFQDDLREWARQLEEGKK